MSRAPDLVENGDDLRRADGKRVVAKGRYCPTFLPIRGALHRRLPEDRAMLILADRTTLYLDPLDSPQSVRPPSEIARFNGKRVRVNGIAHKIMPSIGEGLLAPCLSDVVEIAEDPAEPS
jgi:hypothetical protein